MTTRGEQQIDEYLARLTAQCRSAPAGIYWHDFYMQITHGFPKNDRPGVPLILAASIASDAAKQECLRQHLLWANARGRLTEAFQLLDQIPREGWSVGSPETWSKSFSWEDDE